MFGVPTWLCATLSFCTTHAVLMRINPGEVITHMRFHVVTVLRMSLGLRLTIRMNVMKTIDDNLHN